MGPSDASPAIEGIGPSQVEPNGRNENSNQDNVCTNGDVPGVAMLGTNRENSNWEHDFISKRSSGCTTPKTGGEEIESNQESPRGESAVPQ